MCLVAASFTSTNVSASPLIEANVTQIDANADLKNMLKAIDPNYTSEKITDGNGKITQQIKFQKKDKIVNMAGKYLRGYSLDSLTANRTSVAVFLSISKDAKDPNGDGVLFFLRKDAKSTDQWKVLHTHMDAQDELYNMVQLYRMTEDYIAIKKLTEKASVVILSQPKNAGNQIFKSMFIFNDDKVHEIYHSLVTVPYADSSTDSGEEETEDFEYSLVESPYFRGQFDLAILETKSKCPDNGTCTGETKVINYCYYKEDSLDGYDDSKEHCVFKKAAAASQLKGKFSATNLIDNNPGTTWAEGVAGSGIGQWVQVDLKKPATIAKATILPGYAKANKTWLENNRLKKARLSFSDGTKIEIDFKDSKSIEPQTFPITIKKPVTWMKAEILEVYKGDKFDDTCISEISVAP